MKKLFILHVFVALFLNLIIPDIAFSQGGIGITTGDPYVPVKVNSGIGFDTGVKGGSALEQLENMTGKKVTSSSTNSRTVAPVKVVNTISQAALFQNAMKMQLASGIASALIGMIFSDNSKNNAQAAEAQRQQAILLAQRAAEEKRIADLIAQEKFEKMMKDYKLLNDPNGLKIKTLSSGGIQFKSLDDHIAPLTMAEIERQNLIRRGISVTWDSNSWAQASSNGYKMEEPNTEEENGPDKYLEAAINKIETFQGGRVAALAGRYMLNIKKETMSYLRDASDAALSNNIARMDEVGNVDLRAKLSSNALNTSYKQTLNAYGEQAKDFVSGQLDDANFGIMKSGGMDLLQKNMPNEWKMPLRP